MKNLKDKIVLITGGGAGFGKAIAARFVAEGSKVVIADIDVKAGQTTADALGGHFIRTDVSDADSVQAAVAFTVETHGRLDVMVNNAGVESAQAPIHACSMENWNRVVAVNLNGVFYGMKYALAQFVKQGSGNIVNISSVGGMIAFPGLPAYSAAKGGVSNLTRGGALEYAAQGIRVNAIAPTAVMTEMNERMKRDAEDPEGFVAYLNAMNPMPGTPTAEDIAAAAAFLASDDAAFITGVILPIDGGFTAQ
ncbi:SDR family NAD(P)-dependent oxidoreductase [Rhizorhabdus dicambivorans]|uniref:3-oxoacyl-ACP reductase n=1 Tax=Rhizorhabdus dicambivorans TaxID=1850238 RepID=A0A2A4FXL9_9SPHN|nr:glucose 1-dehydrogenase [Rhizorhabdus dicambivorans]ATE65831.1 3-oxoacyl-ACP reductase [Rhizorhabdus dicambivorans]PCE42945.1 3-oxoacyl-ACP reductase [Rhizorhabdus dicambivorans]